MGRSPAILSTIFVSVVSLLCGLLHALPFIGNLPSTTALASAARGLHASDAVRVPIVTGWSDSVNGWLWQSGGASGLATGQWISVFITWTVAAGVILLGVVALICLVHLRRGPIVIIAGAVLLLLTASPSVL